MFKQLHTIAATVQLPAKNCFNFFLKLSWILLPHLYSFVFFQLSVGEHLTMFLFGNYYDAFMISYLTILSTSLVMTKPYYA